MADSTQQLDTRIEVITPENIAFQYRLAGPFRRLPAYLIDLGIRATVLVITWMLLMFIFGSLGLLGIGMGVFLVFWFLLSWFYGGLFETFWNGQTPGKRLMRIRVLTVEGQPINALQAVLRNVLRAADAMPVVFMPWAWEAAPIPLIPLYQIGLVATMCNSRFQRLGDLPCGTMVVAEQWQWAYGVVRVTEQEAIRLAADLPANLQVSRGLARALSSYVERRQGFGPARRAEIARHLAEPLLATFNLPRDTSYDLLLCALYYRTFIADRVGAESSLTAAGIGVGKSPEAMEAILVER